MTLSRPTQIGRYEVLAHLATGGMAELYLGRIVGPSGFSRPVAIKQILPHLARDPEFRDMFLDEARITARIRHPNVVQVEELALDEDALFLVMEYLSGETLGELYRWLVENGRQLEPVLAAYVVAEVAAGLQAAHELLDEHGRPAGLVHRDVSPDNIFVTYDGCIKVLDFGIALSHGRQTRTQTGAVKGKMSYMSPEHGSGEPLDPRSDLFSLGIVLHELISGRRLFKRPNDLLTLKAITEEPIPGLQELVPDCPPRLAEICAGTLERDRGRRFQSARALRHELLAALHALAPASPPPEERLRGLMNRAFAVQRAERSALLQAVEKATETKRFAGRAARPIRRWPVVSLVVLTILAGAGWLFYDRAPRSHIAATPPVVAPPAASARVVVHIETTPPGATVTIAGRALGVTPLDLPLERSASALVLSIARAGYDDVVEQVVPDQDQRLRLALTPLRPALRRPQAGSHGRAGSSRHELEIPRFD